MLVAEERDGHDAFGGQQSLGLDLDAGEAATEIVDRTRGVAVGPARDQRQAIPQLAEVVGRLLPVTATKLARQRGPRGDCLLDRRGQRGVEWRGGALALEA